MLSNKSSFSNLSSQSRSIFRDFKHACGVLSDTRDAIEGIGLVKDYKDDDGKKTIKWSKYSGNTMAS